MNKELIMLALSELPEREEWWRDGGYRAFRFTAGKMLGAGMDVEEVKNILADLYSAVSGEYGN